MTTSAQKEIQLPPKFQIILLITHASRGRVQRSNSTKAATEETDPERANQGEKEYKVAKGNYGKSRPH